MGPTYYMRLKHMVKDKINYRARGPRTNLTRQTVQGRANDGGLRIGEMERDGVLAHGASLFLQESLMVRGDEYYMAVCNKTGMIAIYNENKNIFLSPISDGPLKFNEKLDGTMNIENVSKHGRSFSVIRVPYAFKLLVQELQTINIQIRVITDDNIDQLTSMSFSNNIIKLKGDDNVLLKTKKVLSVNNEIDPEEYKKHKDILFGNYIEHSEEFWIDESSSQNLSTTTYSIANSMTKKIINAILTEFDEEDDMSIIRRMNIVDAQSAVGVNTMSFMRYFGHVDAIEQDSKLVNILKHNLDLFSSKNNIKLDRYQIYQGKYKDIIATENIKKDVIFFEPQENVAGVGDGAVSELMIDDIKVESVISDMLEIFAFVIIKLPLDNIAKKLELEIEDNLFTLVQGGVVAIDSHDIIYYDNSMGLDLKLTCPNCQVRKGIMDIPEYVNLIQSQIKFKYFQIIIYIRNEFSPSKFENRPRKSSINRGNVELPRLQKPPGSSNLRSRNKKRQHFSWRRPLNDLSATQRTK
jgi:hypothetical protein